MLMLAALIASGSLGLAQQPWMGVACSGQPNITTCGRVGIGVWLRHPAASVNATVAGVHVKLHPGGFGGPGPTYWEGYPHLNLHRLGLPRSWAGERPIKILKLRLTVRYPHRVATGTITVQLRAGWG